MVSEKEILDFYKNNSNTITCEVFDISRSYLDRILHDNGIIAHDTKTNRELTNLYRYGVKNTGCSKEKQEKAKQTTKERYGNSNFRNVEKAKQTRILNSGSIEESYRKGTIKIQENNIQKYGVKNFFETDEFKLKSAETCKERYGVDNFRKSSDYMKRYSSTCFDKYGVTHYSKTKDYIEKVSNTCNRKYDSSTWFGSNTAKYKLKSIFQEKYDVKNPMQHSNTKEKLKQSFLDKYGVDNPMKLKEIHRKISKNRNYIASNGEGLDSSYELLVYEFCLKNNIPIKHLIPIEYEFNNSKHITFIDFEIDGILFEVKGGHLLKGCFDYKGVPISKKLEVYRNNNVVIITDDTHTDIFDDVLCGVDINLFNSQLEHPQDFRDDIIRWNRIKYCIQFYKNFISIDELFVI